MAAIAAMITTHIESAIKAICAIFSIIFILYYSACVKHMYTISADFFRLIFCDFYSAVISVIIPLVTVTVCEAVVNDPVAPVGRSPIVAT